MIVSMECQRQKKNTINHNVIDTKTFHTSIIYYSLSNEGLSYLRSHFTFSPPIA